MLFDNREEPVDLVVDTLVSTLKGVKSGMDRLCPLFTDETKTCTRPPCPRDSMIF